MNLEELRIGNYVYSDASHEVFEIQSTYTRKYQNWQNEYSNDITGDYPQQGNEHGNMWNVYLSDMAPINLNKNTLSMVGFKEYTSNGGHLVWEKGDFKLLDGKLPFPIKQKKRILHMHELQNLYFAVTGERLKLK